MDKIAETTKPTGDLFVRRHGEVPHRNPARVPHMVNLLHIAWAQKGNTDMRLGQLLTTAARLGGWPGDSIWNCEEEVFAKGFLEMLKSDTEAIKG